MKRYDGWNRHKFAGPWHCRLCRRLQYREDGAFYIGIMNGPYCVLCRLRIEQPDKELGVLTDNPCLDKMHPRGHE